MLICGLGDLFHVVLRGHGDDRRKDRAEPDTCHAWPPFACCMLAERFREPTGLIGYLPTGYFLSAFGRKNKAGLPLPARKGQSREKISLRAGAVRHGDDRWPASGHAAGHDPGAGPAHRHRRRHRSLHVERSPLLLV
jgi:hypothetical protein